MNNQLSHYISIDPDFFQELEGEFEVKITGKLANFLSTVEIVRPDRFMTSDRKRPFPVHLANLRRSNCPAQFMKKSWWKTVMMN